MGCAPQETTNEISLSLRAAVWTIAALVAASALGWADESGLSRRQAFARASALRAIGERIFFDASLSASGNVACATCRDPDHAFGPANARAVQFGGKDGRQAGVRAVPSRLPLLSPFEMANESAAALAASIRQTAYADELRKVVGEHRFADDEAVVAGVAEALEGFEQDERFYPYSSKYDAYLVGRAKLSP